MVKFMFSFSSLFYDHYLRLSFSQSARDFFRPIPQLFSLGTFRTTAKSQNTKKKHITKSMRNALSVPSSVEPIIHSHAFLILLLMLLLFVVFIRFGDISTVIPHNRLCVCLVSEYEDFCMRFSFPAFCHSVNCHLCTEC